MRSIIGGAAAVGYEPVGYAADAVSAREGGLCEVEAWQFGRLG